MSTSCARRRSFAVLAIGLGLAQIAGCGSCVKDEDMQPDPSAGPGRRAIDPRAADKRLSQYSTQSVEGGAADATTD